MRGTETLPALLSALSAAVSQTIRGIRGRTDPRSGSIRSSTFCTGGMHATSTDNNEAYLRMRRVEVSLTKRTGTKRRGRTKEAS